MALKAFNITNHGFKLIFAKNIFHFSFFLTTERSEVVLFLEYSSAAAYEVAVVRDSALRKLPYFFGILEQNLEGVEFGHKLRYHMGFFLDSDTRG